MHFPIIIGHRGAAALAPENTMESFRLAIETHKVPMVEFDIHFSADGVPVIIHDALLKRTTNATGYVNRLTVKDLQRLDAGYFFTPKKDGTFPFRNKNIRIPTLEELIKSFPSVQLAVEIKENSAELTASAVELLRKYKAEDRSIVGSKHDRVFQTMKSDFPHIRRFCSQKFLSKILMDFKRGKTPSGKDPMSVASIPTREMQCNLDTAEIIAYFHAMSIKVFYWTINDTDQMKVLANRGADGIITDDPAIANQAFARN